jgi:hypothetical protein
MTTASRREMRVEELLVPSLVAAQTSSERNPPKSKGQRRPVTTWYFLQICHRMEEKEDIITRKKRILLL